ncbi:MAG: hypothetical protein Q9204_006706, partial [Flavoplaca sp. TL-2023a]
APLPQWIRSNFRYASSSSTRWQTRQNRDKFAIKAKVEGLKSRAAYKLLEVAVDRTRPNGLVLGIDVIPAQPPRGVSTIQGNFLSQTVQDEVKRFLRANWNRKHQHQSPSEEENEPWLAGGFGKTPRSCLEQERHAEILAPKLIHGRKTGIHAGRHMIDIHGDGIVDVVLSDMSAPWEQTEGFWKRSLSDPYYRMMNTSGINFKDHAGSMDLCEAALKFAIDTLRTGGNFICKFYQGAEDKTLEAHLKTIFTKVYRDKPASSRSVWFPSRFLKGYATDRT